MITQTVSGTTLKRPFNSVLQSKKQMLLILRRIRDLLGFTCFDNDIVLVEKSPHSVTRALRRN